MISNFFDCCLDSLLLDWPSLMATAGLAFGLTSWFLQVSIHLFIYLGVVG